MATKKNIKVRDLKPSKDAKGGGATRNNHGLEGVTRNTAGTNSHDLSGSTKNTHKYQGGGGGHH